MPEDADTQPEPPKTYEQAIDQLERIVERIESGEIGLEEALKQYEAGTELIKRCRGILDSAERRIAELTSDPEGNLAVEGDEAENDTPGSSEADDIDRANAAAAAGFDDEDDEEEDAPF